MFELCGILIVNLNLMGDKMPKILVMSIYFGKMPEHFPAFCESVKKNSNIDFLLVTDANVENLPKNMRVKNISFEETVERFRSLFDFDIVLDRPYKLCDFKPVWCCAFSEELKDYDFWGVCDLDMIFGNILNFLPEEIFEHNDKIYELAHLMFYRNSNEVIDRYKLSGGESYKTAFSSNEIFAFDEIAGMQNIYDANKFSSYKSRDYADITYCRYRFTLSDFRIDQYGIEPQNNNYQKQLFYWEDGRVYRAYLKDGQIFTEEFNYIHFSKRKMFLNGYNENWNAYFITNKGLFKKGNEVTEADFDKYNPTEPKQEAARERETKKTGRKNKRKYYLSIIKKKLGLK